MITIPALTLLWVRKSRERVVRLINYCPCDSARNHGQYQSCMVQAVNSFIEVGLLAKQDKGRILSESARSSCGKEVSGD